MNIKLRQQVLDEKGIPSSMFQQLLDEVITRSVEIFEKHTSQIAMDMKSEQ